MYKLYFRISLLLAVLLIFTSCAKTPAKIVSPSVKVEVAQGVEKSWMLIFTGGLKNENASTAFLKVEGSIILINDSGDKLSTLSFKIPAVLPFETGMIKEKIEIKGDEAMKIFSMLSVSPDKIGNPGEQGSRFLEEKNVKLDSINFEKKDIVKLLGEKIK